MNRLVIDIGNTRTKLGVFKNSNLEIKSVHTRLSKKKIENIVRLHGITSGILSSTRKLNKSILEKFNAIDNLMVLDHTVAVPVNVDYKTPQTLGNDRLAGVVGAKKLFPDEQCLIIDVGTCITIDLLSNEGAYKGGVITPGLQMRLDAMHHFTGKLPSLNIDDPVEIGKSTKDSMMCGAIDGAIHEIRGFISRYKTMFGNLRVILTGGDRDFFAIHLKRKIFVVPSLVLIGLNEILLFNGAE